MPLPQASHRFQANKFAIFRPGNCVHLLNKYSFLSASAKHQQLYQAIQVASPSWLSWENPNPMYRSNSIPSTQDQKWHASHLCQAILCKEEIHMWPTCLDDLFYILLLYKCPSQIQRRGKRHLLLVSGKFFAKPHPIFLPEAISTAHAILA